MVVEDVPLHPTRDPRPQHPDEGRLDHALPIEEVVAVGLVLGGEDAAADLGQDGDLQVLVLQPQRPVGPILPLVEEPVEERVGVDGPPRPLVLASRVEHRVRLRGPDRVGRDASGDSQARAAGSSAGAGDERATRRPARTSARFMVPPGARIVAQDAPARVSPTAQSGRTLRGVRHAALLAAGLLATAAQVLLLRELVVDGAGDEANSAWASRRGSPGSPPGPRPRGGVGPLAARRTPPAASPSWLCCPARHRRRAAAPSGPRAGRWRAAGARPRHRPLARDARAAGRRGRLDVHRARLLGLAGLGSGRGHRAPLHRRVARLAPRRRGRRRLSRARGRRPCASRRAPRRRRRRSSPSLGARRGLLARPRLLVGTALVSLAVVALAPALDGRSERARFSGTAPGLPLRAFVDTPYQHLALGGDDVLHLYASGQYAGSFPDPCAASSLGHLLALLAPRPRSVLLVGGAQRGLVPVLLQHPVRRVDRGGAGRGGVRLPARPAAGGRPGGAPRPAGAGGPRRPAPLRRTGADRRAVRPRPPSGRRAGHPPARPAHHGRVPVGPCGAPRARGCDRGRACAPLRWRSPGRRRPSPARSSARCRRPWVSCARPRGPTASCSGGWSPTAVTLDPAVLAARWRERRVCPPSFDPAMLTGLLAPEAVAVRRAGAPRRGGAGGDEPRRPAGLLPPRPRPPATDDRGRLGSGRGRGEPRPAVPARGAGLPAVARRSSRAC